VYEAAPLDAILNGLVEEERSVNEIVARGFSRETACAYSGCSSRRSTNAARRRPA
jgi:hypothetical protein